MLLLIIAIAACFLCGFSPGDQVGTPPVQPLCPPGTFLNRSSQWCYSCSPGFYTDRENRDESCTRCQECRNGKNEASECTTSKSNICVCPSGFYDSGQNCIKATADNPIAYCAQRRKVSDFSMKMALRALCQTVKNGVRRIRTKLNSTDTFENSQETQRCDQVEAEVEELQRWLNNITASVNERKAVDAPSADSIITILYCVIGCLILIILVLVVVPIIKCCRLKMQRNVPAPHDLRVVETTSTSLSLAWKEPTSNCHCTSRTISGYNLYYYNSSLEQKRSHINALSFNLDELQCNTEYSICVTTLTNVGEGLRSTVLLAKTRENGASSGNTTGVGIGQSPAAADVPNADTPSTQTAAISRTLPGGVVEGATENLAGQDPNNQGDVMRTQEIIELQLVGTPSETESQLEDEDSSTDDSDEEERLLQSSQVQEVTQRSTRSNDDDKGTASRSVHSPQLSVTNVQS